MWKVFLTTFSVMFIAELGDKTQLAVISLASRYRSPVVVFIAASLAMITATAIGTAVGSFLPAIIGSKAIKIVSGTIFIIFGLLILFEK